ncbi:MAG: RluA family pseudouridine synthase [Acidobacteria bacterium]|nr:RluA family pseudouridine synthase [Acidobacteriota bacterium]
MTRDFVAAPDDSNQRLDRVVAAHCPDLSRTRVQELIDSANILLDGKPAKASHRLRGGERITVTAEPRPPIQAEAEDIPLEILYEDDDVVAINKPAGMIVHAGAGNHKGTLVNALLGRGQSLSQGGDILRPGIVHRLDKETSGIILVAKNDLAHARLGEDFRNRKVKKTYIALVEGHLDAATGIIDLAIARDPKRRVRMTARRSLILAGAREARTDWRALARIGPTTLLEVQLHTGRTHQIRVHFSALHHPVVGDTLYGAAHHLTVNKLPLPSLEANRNFLHAAKLGFAQPTTGAWIELRAPLPAPLVSFLHQLASTANDSPQRIDAALAAYL